MLYKLRSLGLQGISGYEVTAGVRPGQRFAQF